MNRRSFIGRSLAALGAAIAAPFAKAKAEPEPSEGWFEYLQDLKERHRQTFRVNPDLYPQAHLVLRTPESIPAGAMVGVNGRGEVVAFSSQTSPRDCAGFAGFAVRPSRNGFVQVMLRSGESGV